MVSIRLLTLLCACLPLWPQWTPAKAEWNRPVTPFRIAGNVYYVGVSDVSAFLITTPAGHILIDAAFRESAPQIEAGIRQLGFQVEDVKLLLSSHAHYDHVAGLAELKAATKGRFLCNPLERAQYERGGKGDFAFGDRFPFPPVRADGALADGVAVELGGVKVTPIFTPGHTRGCTSYSLQTHEGGRNYQIVIACSLSAPDYQLVDNKLYPEIQQDYAKSITRLRALPCDILLGGHSWDFDLPGKLAAPKQAKNPFVDAAALSRYVDKAEENLRQQVARQHAAR